MNQPTYVLRLARSSLVLLVKALNAILYTDYACSLILSFPDHEPKTFHPDKRPLRGITAGKQPPASPIKYAKGPTHETA